MRYIKSIERRSNVSEIRQFLQTLHKEFFQNRQIADKNDKKESIFLLIRRLSNNVRTVEKTNHRNVRFVVFFIWIEDVSRIRLVRLRVNRNFISKREWWSHQINNLFFQNVIFRWMQLWDLRQRIINNYSMLWAVTNKTTISRKIY